MGEKGERRLHRRGKTAWASEARLTSRKQKKEQYGALSAWLPLPCSDRAGATPRTSDVRGYQDDLESLFKMHTPKL